MIYKSKKDTWVMVVIVGSILVTLIAGASLILFAPAVWLRFIGIVIMLASLLPVLLTTPVSYTIDGNSLHIRGGYKHWTIPLQNITAVRPSRNWIASPALSLERLEIEYKDREENSLLLISPERAAQFLAELAQLDPELISVGGGLSRKA
ncbi:MAG: PH domain-containing protein [Blastocatellia bacterium]|nr:PH domain-containing protein [Blastocatellia bacterium]